ncbi:hypothetical protein BGZ63DRAFT_449958 [Mariannaea sp. PMI_226]|nr:hypothetical protein BGZ63DRAFT_449958 [Mariannaea sp. PMI_226]
MKFPNSADTTTVVATVTEVNTPVTVTVTDSIVTITSITGTNTDFVTSETTTETDVTATNTDIVTDSTQIVTDTTSVTTKTVFTTTATIVITTDKAPQQNAKRTAAPHATISVPPRNAVLQNRAHLAAHARNFRRIPVDPLASLFSSLTDQPASVIQSACSCIETKPPTDTSISTVFVTEGGASTTQDVTATVTTPVETTVTVSVTATVTIFTADTKTVSVVETLTDDVVETVTVSTATTTTVYTVIPTPSCTAGSQQAGGLYDCIFLVSCGSRITSVDGETSTVYSGVTSLSQCLLGCSDDPFCNVFSFDGLASTCTHWDDSTGGGGSANSSPDEYSDFGTFTGSCG